MCGAACLNKRRENFQLVCMHRTLSKERGIFLLFKGIFKKCSQKANDQIPFSSASGDKMSRKLLPFLREGKTVVRAATRLLSPLICLATVASLYEKSHSLAPLGSKVFLLLPPAATDWQSVSSPSFFFLFQIAIYI